MVMRIDGNQVDPFVFELVRDTASGQFDQTRLRAFGDGHAPDFEIEIVVFMQGDVQAISFVRALDGVGAAAQKTIFGIRRAGWVRHDVIVGIRDIPRRPAACQIVVGIRCVV